MACSAACYHCATCLRAVQPPLSVLVSTSLGSLSNKEHLEHLGAAPGMTYVSSTLPVCNSATALIWWPPDDHAVWSAA